KVTKLIVFHVWLEHTVVQSSLQILGTITIGVHVREVAHDEDKQIYAPYKEITADSVHLRETTTQRYIMCSEAHLATTQGMHGSGTRVLLH
ncbi:hypothetical protein ACJX0J_026896, partial [Zea mays]